MVIILSEYYGSQLSNYSNFKIHNDTVLLIKFLIKKG